MELVSKVKQHLYRPGKEVQAPRICRQSAHEDGKDVNPSHRPPLPPGDTPGTHFC